MRLALGTAQFGLPYGIANASGQVDQAEVQTILDYANLKGIDTLDTAISYGDSEQLLGDVGVNNWKVISKLPEIPPDCKDLAKWVRNHVNQSLNRLGIKTLSGLLLHRPNQLLDPNYTDLWSTLIQLKRDGKVKKIGFSIYSPKELNDLWNLYQPDLVQAPYNIFDRTLIKSGWLKKMSNDGVEVHVRSIFLQGLLLIDKKNRPKKFHKWKDLWNIWDKWLIDNSITALEASLSFVLSEPRISRIIVGVDGLNQLKQILNASRVCVDEFPINLCTTDKELINPSNWSSL